MDVPGFAIVTGAASGIGRACAMTFARDGAAGVALFDRNADELANSKAMIDAKGYISSTGQPCKIITLVVDVTNEELVNTSVQSVKDQFGRIDYLVNAAGLAFKHVGGAAFADTKEFNRVLDVNLNGTFYMLKAAAKIMLKQDRILSVIDGRPLQRGSIVNFSSIQGVIATPMSTSYVVSKHAVLGLTRTASEDYAKDGLRINAVCPGYVETPMTMNAPAVLKVMQEKVATSVPMMRAAQPEEIADGVVFMSGGRSSFMTGSGIVIDGGYTQR